MKNNQDWSVIDLFKNKQFIIILALYFIIGSTLNIVCTTKISAGITGLSITYLSLILAWWLKKGAMR